MSKFCTKCGKPIDECICANKKANFRRANLSIADEYKNSGLKMLRMFSKVDESINENSVSDNAWWVNGSICAVSLYIMLMIGLSKIFEIIYEPFIDESISLIDITFEYHMKYFIIILLIVLVSLFGLAALVYFFGDKVLNKKYNYMKIVNKFSYLLLITSTSAIAIGIGICLHAYIAFAIATFYSFYLILVTYEYIKTYFNADDKKNIILIATPIIWGITVVITNYTVKLFSEVFL